MNTLALTARLVTEATLAKGPDLPIRFHSTHGEAPRPIPQDGKVVLLLPGQGARGAGHGILAVNLVNAMRKRGYSVPLGVIGSSSGGPAAADVGIAALGRTTPSEIRERTEERWLAPYHLLSRFGRFMRNLLPGPQYEVRRAMLEGINFDAVMGSPTTVGVVGARTCVLNEAGPIVGSAIGAGVTLGQLLVYDSKHLPKVLDDQVATFMKSVRHGWEAVGWVNQLPEGVAKPSQVRIVQDSKEMAGAMMATMNLPFLFGTGYTMMTDLGPEGTTIKVLDGAIAMGAAVTEAVLLGATDIVVVTDSGHGHVYWNDVSAAIIKGVRRVTRMAKAKECHIPSHRVRRTIDALAGAFETRGKPRNVVATMKHPRLNPEGRPIRLYGIPVSALFPSDTFRFGEPRPRVIRDIMDLSEGMGPPIADVLFPNV